eukprot:CAMPEP_0182873996 /NCGR_PEP_ID=MMETSP0034_2-20130328/12670_1 /TAXON_ID=156128 /ORGANISM="Nephroselmis pyriformis, Strain CCMP717" /LENGTH=90 /DNA_ID=CAMNT_0025006687 /DNA_START=22 /DNA_END=294 /DNA_ORIENTATION=-
MCSVMSTSCLPDMSRASKLSTWHGSEGKVMLRFTCSSSRVVWSTPISWTLYVSQKYLASAKKRMIAVVIPIMLTTAPAAVFWTRCSSARV